MKLLTSEIKRKLPAIHATEEVPTGEKVLVAKWFDPYSQWTWFACEGAPTEDGDFLFFGLVHGFEKEWGYFLLSELAGIRSARRGLGIERDLYFQPCKVSELRV